MFYAYVLKSINHDYYYKGHCENLQKRLKEHNSGMTTSLRRIFHSPFIILKNSQIGTTQLPEKNILSLLREEDFLKKYWPRSTMDSIRVSEALDPRSIRGEATKLSSHVLCLCLEKHQP